MSVVEYRAGDKVMVLCHRTFLERVHQGLDHFDAQLALFDIRVPFRMDEEAEGVARRMEAAPGGEVMAGRRKRRAGGGSMMLQAEVDYLAGKQEVLASLRPAHFPGTPSAGEVRQNNRAVRDGVKRLLAGLEGVEVPGQAANPGDTVVEEGGVILPPRSNFVRCDVLQGQPLPGPLGGADLVVVDPPWQNRHVKRVRQASGYGTVADSALAGLPLGAALRPGGLALVWCTNSARHREALAACLAAWGLSLEATCYWVKVTRHGELVSPLVAGGKQPYEVVVAARRPGTESPAAGLMLPDGLVLYSVPSGLHSHKPPLEEVLGAVAGRELVAGLAKLEVFGRSLLPGWTTLGLQPCLLNTRPADH